ncbi:hypothetical protein HanXRQr2_Chr09g0401511 [Helianthus annuus]|uniref:Uncharacterized protein n=1 Tax=Helianthus annuus TaxID=4232 RepID=A0A9K3N978_HELAN|nr:hypothetical protein HanXRQr2_Chr09g0401511 [Helianthus annuus]
MNGLMNSIFFLFIIGIIGTSIDIFFYQYSLLGFLMSRADNDQSHAGQVDNDQSHAA